MSALMDREHRFVMQTYGRIPVTFVAGRGLVAGRFGG